MKNLKLLAKYFFLFLVGGIIYYLIEVGFRGHSHYSMFILGGVCFICLGLINEVLSWEMPLIVQMLIGSVIITSLEFITGIIVNCIFKMNVWDYSSMPLNFMGQICLLFSIFWFFLAAVGIILDDYLRYWFFHEERPHYKIFN